MKNFVSSSIISATRPALMGIATIMILICHSASWCTDLPASISSILKMGYIGVDIFLFISGVGMYYSWHHHVDQCMSTQRGGVLDWYLKRYKRILVPYIVISIPAYLALCWIDNESFVFFINNVSTFSYWIYHKGAWYIAMLIPLYLITPLLVRLLSNKSSWVFFIILTLICYSCALWNHYFPPITYSIEHNVSFVIYRLPSYFLGITVAKYIHKNLKVSLTTVILILVACAILGTVLYLFKMPFEMFMAIIMIIICTYVFSISNKFTVKLRVVFNKLGKISLESYLFNIFLPILLIRINWDFIIPNLNNGNYFMYIITILSGLLLSLGVNRLVEAITANPNSKIHTSHVNNKKNKSTNY